MVEFQPYQKRVVEEEKQLSERIDALSRWIGSDKFTYIEFDEQVLLREQLSHMLAYQTILLRRIHKITSELQ